MTPPPPLPEHLWLHRLLGNWTWDHEAIPGDPSTEDHSHGESTEDWRLLGDLWLLGEGNSEHGPMMFTLGYDPDRKSFVGSFISALMTFFWTYTEGYLEGPDKLVLHAVGPSMKPEGGMANYRDEIEFLGPDERLLRSFVEGPPGTWTQFMQARYRRR